MSDDSTSGFLKFGALGQVWDPFSQSENQLKPHSNCSQFAAVPTTLCCHHTEAKFQLLDIFSWASQVALVVKNPTPSAGDIRDTGLIPGLGRSPGEGNGNPLQDSCLGNHMDRGAWWATVQKVTESQTPPSSSSSSTQLY